MGRVRDREKRRRASRLVQERGNGRRAASRRPYPSDLSHAEWALLAPLLPAPKTTGRPRKWSERVVARAAEPTAPVIDSQSAKTTGVGGPGREHDAGKRVMGRKRHVLVDVMGSCSPSPSTRPTCRIARALGSSSTGSRGLSWRRSDSCGRTRATPARWPTGCTRPATGDSRPSGTPTGSSCGTGSPSVRRPRSGCCRDGGSSNAPSRGGQALRLSKDYERLPGTSEAMVYGATSRLMLRRLAPAPERRARTKCPAC